MSVTLYDGAEGRPLLDLVIAGMVVVDRDGTWLGTVDKVEGGILRSFVRIRSIGMRTSTSRRTGSWPWTTGSGSVALSTKRGASGRASLMQNVTGVYDARYAENVRRSSGESGLLKR